jgi:hypothetical protein
MRARLADAQVPHNADTNTLRPNSLLFLYQSPLLNRRSHRFALFARKECEIEILQKKATSKTEIG